MRGHELRRPEDINISEGGFVFFTDSAPNFTSSRGFNHSSIYFLLLPLVFPSSFTRIFFSHYTTRITMSSFAIWGYKNCVTVQTGFTTQNECRLLGCKCRVNPAFHGLHFLCTCLFHILCSPQDRSNCLTFDCRRRRMTHSEPEM